MPTPAVAIVAPPPVAEKKDTAFTESGVASWYAKSRKLKRTASGEKMTNDELTAAHPSLPLGTVARVTNLDNGLSVIVRINDRGPFKKNRVIDVSKLAATRLGMTGAGIAQVRVDVYVADQLAVRDFNGFALSLYTGKGYVLTQR